ncbi:EpsG family protein [Butyrivibrio sp. X503]|uniref:EpsG family protein n=1 Tax=Butyrivibrio sp. X503 TaxID=2364878 RepID=UPI000EAA06EB|nr:EpsG family protein [Butyrivibrio sp. X503]RKM54246.1 EpsG family protein [Butyrivibrio sp. X503]
MAVYLALTAFVILTAMLIKKTEFNTEYAGNLCVYRGMKRQDMVNIIAMFTIFMGLFLVAALRVNVGNDYAKHVEFMHLAYCDAYVPTEWGFNMVTRVIYSLCGSEQFILVFAFFAFFTVLFFMKAIWDQSEWFLISFVMFMFLGYYFQSLSTTRYYLALGIALFSIKYVIKKDWPKFVFFALVGCLFHKSMFMILVFYPLCRIKWKRWMYVVGAAFCVSCLFLQDLYLKIAIHFYSSYKDNADEYVSGISYVNIARCIVVLALALWVFRDKIRESGKYSFYFHCNLMALALYVFGSFLPIVSRIGYYLNITQILFVPAIIKNIKDEKKRKLLTVATVVGCILYFMIYMRGAANDGIRILPYRTILFHDMPPILSEKGY